MSARGDAGALMVGGVRGSVLIGGAAAVGAIGALAAQVLFERSLGVAGFAQWAFLNSLITIFVPIACLGANHLVLSEHYAGRLHGRAGVVDLGRYFVFWGVLATACIAAAYAVGAPEGRRAPIALLVAVFIVQIPIGLVFPVFQARGRAGWVAAWPLAHIGLRLVVAGAALIAAWNFVETVAAWAIGCTVVAGVALAQFRPSLLARWRRTDAALPRPGHRIWRAGLGFGLADMLDSLDVKLIVPLAAALFDPVATAAAGIAVVLLSAASYFPYVLVQRVLLPAVHSRHAADREGVRRMVRRLCKWCVIGLAPLALAWYVRGYDLVAWLVKGDYASQAGALSLLSLSALPLFVSQLAAAPHMARRRTWHLLRWRIESVLVFCAAAVALRGLGLTSLILAFALGRVWLCWRVLRPYADAEVAP